MSRCKIQDLGFRKGMLILIILTSYFLVPIATPVLAQQTEYTLLQPIPLNGPAGGDSSKATASDYIKGLFQLLIAIATGLAVLAIIFGGIKYMSTDAFGGKSEAKATIEHAIWGLLLAISAWLILNTISPNLTTFNLQIKQLPPITTPTPGTGGGGGSVGNVGCQGNCPFSYVNSSGVTVSYKDCLLCSPAASFGLSIKTPTVNGTAAQINTSLGSKLKAVQDTSGSPSFRVTEAWPPTVNHLSQQQYNGTAVDVSLATPNATNIKTFINNARAKGLSVVYEVKTFAESQAYINAGVPLSGIIVVPYITGEHFSVK